MVFNEGNKNVVETCFWPPNTEKNGDCSVVPVRGPPANCFGYRATAFWHFCPSVNRSKPGRPAAASESDQCGQEEQSVTNAKEERRKARAEAETDPSVLCRKNTKRNGFVFCPAGGRALMVWACVCVYDAVEKAGHFCVRTLRPRTCVCVCLCALEKLLDFRRADDDH